MPSFNLVTQNKRVLLFSTIRPFFFPFLIIIKSPSIHKEKGKHPRDVLITSHAFFSFFHSFECGWRNEGANKRRHMTIRGVNLISLFLSFIFDFFFLRWPRFYVVGAIIACGSTC